MPWESSFSKILDSVQGLAPVFATIAFLIAGFVLMFGESGGMSRKVLWEKMRKLHLGGGQGETAEGIVEAS